MIASTFRVNSSGIFSPNAICRGRADVKELARMPADEYATVKDSVSRAVGLDQAVRTLTFPQHKDWRNYGRLQGEIRALYELIQTAKRSYLE
jgi:hypothetical protein